LARKRLSFILFLLLAAHAAVFVFVVSQTLILTPFGDVVAWLEQYAAFKQNGDLVHYLLAPHNEHRLVTIRLLTVADMEIFGGRGFAFIGAALASVAGILALLLTELRRDGEVGLSPGIIVTIALVLTVPMAIDCSMPVNSLYPITLLFLVAAVVLALRKQILLAIPVALLASFTNAIGLVVWPVLLWVSISRVRWLWLLLLVVTSAGVCGAFMVTAEQSQNYAAHSIWDVVSYWPLFVGLPWSRSLALQMPAEILGVALIAAALAFGAHGRGRDGLQTMAVAFVLLSLGCSLMAAAGRSGMHEPYPPIRYSIFMLPTHLALLFFAIRRKWLSEPIAIAILAVLVVQQVLSGYIAVQTARSLGVPTGF
jgi:hypothetical protein